MILDACLISPAYLFSQRSTLTSDPKHRDVAPLHLVYLVNFFAPDQVAIWEELARLVKQITILVSVDMEGNRDWKPEQSDLDVRRQRTWTITRKIKHSTGYTDVNYVHLPLDTRSQLRKLKPDVVVSAELGMRSLLASRYCRRSKAKHILAISTSEHLDEVDGGLRTRFRRSLLRRSDLVTYHGPSCKRFLEKLDVPAKKLHPFDYACDPNKPYRGDIDDSLSAVDTLRLLSVGQLVERKGMVPALERLKEWAKRNPTRHLIWTIAGSGPLEQIFRQSELPPNLSIKMTGHLDQGGLRDQYQSNEVLFFPTLADEWGLVVDEALFSGMGVMGSIYAQAIETLIFDGTNGWSFDPLNPQSLDHMLDGWFNLNLQQRYSLRQRARDTVVNRTPKTAADQLMSAIEVVAD
ncbi:glycosyltransferase family 4 protein [Rubripirellula amarantea]|nr:glycosyltransferase family 4 protein [Rubripirellula amarantea]